MFRLATFSLALSLLSGVQATSAEPPPRISALTNPDREFMSQQRARIDNLARSRLGRQINTGKDNNLDILQVLLDRKLARAEQTLELQAMGVIMGDALADALGMEWIIYQDKLGRSRALQIPGSEHYLFPVTMISRRVEAGAQVSVQAVYNKARSLMQPHIRKLPFQYQAPNPTGF